MSLPLGCCAQQDPVAAPVERVRRLPRTVPLPTAPPPAGRWLLDATGSAKLTEDIVVTWQTSLAGWYVRRLEPRGKVWLGGGLRLTRVRDEGSNYLAARKSSARREGFYLTNKVGAANLAAHIQWRPTHWLRLGGNLDLGGLSWGDSYVQYLPIDLDGWSPKVRPQRGNLLLGNTNDRGTLTSELYAGLSLNSHFTARFGLHHTGTTLLLDDERYQRFYTALSAGLTWDL